MAGRGRYARGLEVQIHKKEAGAEGGVGRSGCCWEQGLRMKIVGVMG